MMLGMAQHVHPPLSTRTGHTPTSVAEVPPERCDGGHPLTRPILVGWHPCSCGGHRTYYCACGVTNHFHARPEPRQRCTMLPEGFSEPPGERRADPS